MKKKEKEFLLFSRDILKIATVTVTNKYFEILCHAAVKRKLEKNHFLQIFLSLLKKTEINFHGRNSSFTIFLKFLVESSPIIVNLLVYL
jgi:hypothetical protein